MLTIDEFLDLFVERESQLVNIYDCDAEKYVYEGIAENIPNILLNYDISSLDNIMKDKEYITINIYSKY